MDKSSRHIPVQERTAHERRKRQREITLAAVGIFLIVILTWIELRLLGLNSYLFFALFNVNLILLILVLFLVLRNVIKLVLDRRRRVLGSGLRAKLVLVFVTLSMVPTFIMFVLSTWFVQTSVDYWFQAQVETSMDQALSVGQDFYASAESGLEIKALGILEHLRERKLDFKAKGADEALRKKSREYRLSLSGVITGTMQQQQWESTPVWNDIWPRIRSEVPFAELAKGARYWSTLWPHPDSDLVIGVMPVDEAGSAFLVVGAEVGAGFLDRLELIAQGVGEYKQLRSLKYPLKMTLYMVLGLMTMLIFLGATWFGFRLARELSAPIQALAAGTQRIAQGDLSVRLMDESRDELGLLVQSFNSMAEDLEQSRTHLTRANLQLEEQYQALIAKNHYVQAILENITAGVVSLDRAGRITTMNRAAEGILGLEAGALIGESALDLMGPAHRGLVQEVSQLLRGSPGSQWQRRLDLEVGGETIKLLINAVALMDNEGGDSGIVAVFENISELEKMQRLDAWKEVARRIAHEIKNPLTPIKLSAERLERKFGPVVADPVFTQCTGLIVKQVEHLQEMVREFSSFAKLPEVMLSAGRVEPLLQEAISVFSNSHASIRWVLRAEDVPAVMLDREAMGRAIYNILLNAAEVLADQEDGRVETVLYARKRKGRIYIEISDNGPGIKPEEQSRMFEPYYSTKRSGTGLGLAIVKSIISDHHGHIRVKPNEPAGTTFVIELPAARGEA
ncbi:two-component system, NtrC family, nitrogen regulation sensor histidine kinase NtrY [Desulfomicrobium norvegicum]|uniref:histidine kinase n=1 Tax=Desulfomicrobium norvegicum (strain DSM 1741 / NCIMB 8310) TaxID=52561 RepID=A0A8G2C240_DESNO|nr:ATP-binding protein [Desulfomicrobium norvegicum]SFL61464.1 two-component system, NtrC family, nitrogen regulation sensor histidine kinase NtrY [Desulfomicrobium norvegicum]